MSVIDQTPFVYFLLAAATLGLAPFVPEPHIVEKLRMLASGTLVRPLDWFDLALHAAPWLALVVKLVRMAQGAY